MASFRVIFALLFVASMLYYTIDALTMKTCVWECNKSFESCEDDNQSQDNNTGEYAAVIVTFCSSPF